MSLKNKQDNGNDEQIMNKDTLVVSRLKGNKAAVICGLQGPVQNIGKLLII